MSTRASSHPYLLIWVGLVLLFALSVGASFLLPPAAAVTFSILVAFAKATLVAAFFMHLIDGPRFLTYLFLGSLICLLVLFLGLVPDIALQAHL